MKKEAALVIVKPDGIALGLIGKILQRFEETELEIIGIKISEVSKEKAESHYRHLKKESFFKEVIGYIMGEYHKNKRIMAIVYYGKDAIKKLRDIAGATNPNDADPHSIRGAYGRVTDDGKIENVVHVSSDIEDAEREIKLWFRPDEILESIYHSETSQSDGKDERVWV